MKLKSIITTALLCGISGHAFALGGATPDKRFADRVAMVLFRGNNTAGYCSALVLNSRTLLTAAHCLRPLRDMAVHYRDASGASVIIAVEAAAVHPLYRANAIPHRVMSIDVALIRTTRPLDPLFVNALIDTEIPAVGEQVILSGYGMAFDGEWKTGGQLRSLTLSVSEPASSMLIWAADRNRTEAGACDGDSGDPIWSADGKKAVAITTWAPTAQGYSDDAVGGKARSALGPSGGCGGLTLGLHLSKDGLRKRSAD